MIIAKIDVTLLDKAKFFPGKKANVLGKCPQYVDIVLFDNKHGEDQYGNHFVVMQSQSKEDRSAGKKGMILGNAKIIGTAPKAKPAPMINQLRKPGPSASNTDPDMPPD